MDEPAVAGAPRRLPATESDLVERLRAGGDAAFEDLVQNYIAQMLTTARRFLRNEDDACDAVQEAFLNVHKSIAQFHQQSSLATWLHRIVVNACLMKLRTRRRRPEGPIDDLLPQFSDDGHHAAPPREWRSAPEEALAREETRDAVRAAIAELPESYQTVLLLRDIDEIDTPETARMLGVNENTVKVRLHPARQALRGILDRRLQSL